MGSRTRQRGASVVEGALALMSFFVVVLGIMEAARFINVKQVVSSAAREGARLSVAPMSGTSNLATTGEIEAEVRRFLDAAGIQSATINVQRPVLITIGGVTNNFTRVQVDVNYQVISMSIFTNLEVILRGEALMRNETSP